MQGTGPDETNPRHDDTDPAATGVTVFAPSLRALLDEETPVVRLWRGCRRAEGPAHFAAGRYLVWSDTPNDRMLRLDECDDRVVVFRRPAGHANGNAVDREGRLVTCEHGARRISRTGHDGSLATLASRHRGQRLNSPNDLAIAPDGAIWFTDPPYGILSDEEGHRADSEIGLNGVYRLDPSTGETRLVADDFDMPNGIAFSRDGRRLHVVDSGASHGAGRPRHVRVFDVDGDGRLHGGRVLAEATDGLFDGLRVDAEDRLWIADGDGVTCLSREGEPLARIRLPEAAANLAFGGSCGDRLYVCASTSLYAVALRRPAGLSLPSGAASPASSTTPPSSGRARSPGAA